MDILKTIGRTAIMFAFTVFIYGCLLMFLWNLTMPQNFGLPYLTFGQAGTIFIIARLLVKPHLIEILMAWHFHFTQEKIRFQPENNVQKEFIEAQLNGVHSSVILELSKRTKLPPEKIIFHLFNYGFDYLMFINSPERESNIKMHEKKIAAVFMQPEIKLLSEKILEYFSELDTKR